MVCRNLFPPPVSSPPGGEEQYEMVSLKLSPGSIDHPDGFPLQEGLNILDGVAIKYLVGFHRDVSQMRGDDGVRELPQRMIRRQRLLVVHVESGTGDRALAQGLDERRLVDNRPAGGVDQIRAAFHEVQLTGA